MQSPATGGSDQSFLITGGTSGVGHAIARGLARTGAKIVIVSRSAESGQKALHQIAQATGNDRGAYLVADLSSQSSIRNAADEFKRKYDHLHVLINAAGALFFEKQMTPEGYERSLAVNYLSHFLLTHQLLDILKASAPSRVLTIAGAPRFLKNPSIDFYELQTPTHYSGLRAAGQAMFGRVAFALELARRLEGTGVTSVAFHPGLVKSSLIRSTAWYIRFLTACMQPFAKDDCDIGVYLATAKEVENTTGVFFDDQRKIVPLNEKYRSLGEELWAFSERWTAPSGSERV